MKILFAVIDKKKYFQNSSRRARPMQAYCSLDHCEQISVKFQSNYVNFHRKYFKISYAKRWLYCLGSNIGNGTNYRWIYDIIGNEDDHFFMAILLTLLFGLVAVNLLLKVLFYGTTLVKRYFAEILVCFYIYVWRHKRLSFTFGLGSRYVGRSSVLIRECVGRFHAIRC